MQLSFHSLNSWKERSAQRMGFLKSQCEISCNESQLLFYSSGPLCLQKLKALFLLIFLKLIFINSESIISVSEEGFFLTKSFFCCNSEDLPAQSHGQTIGSYSISWFLDPSEPLVLSLVCVCCTPLVQPHIPNPGAPSTTEGANTPLSPRLRTTAIISLLYIYFLKI